MDLTTGEELDIEHPLIRSYREILTLDENSTPEEMKKTYRALAFYYHPVRNKDPSAKSVFMRVNEAYSTLSDSKKIEELNNKGIVEFLNKKYARALNTYEDLNQRIPDNIVFLYRLGICYVIMGFKNKKKRLFRQEIPDPIYIDRAIDCFQKGIKLGRKRTYPTQNCLAIRKTLF